MMMVLQNVFILLCMAAVFSYSEGQSNETALRFDDVCKSRYIWLSEPEQEGLIGVKQDSVDSVTDNPCVLTIKACAFCFISVWSHERFALTSSYPNSAPESGIGRCSQELGTQYFMLFDSYYETDSIKYVWTSTQMDTAYNTSSSTLIIVICHFERPLDFTLYYQVKKKLEEISGISGGIDQSGIIRSPHFPLGYYQNSEQYTYIFNSRASTDTIQLIFDDWHLSPSSEIFFDTVPDLLVSGLNNRPVVQSSGPQLKMIFNTGSNSDPGSPLMYRGFKATYRIISSYSYTEKPSTNCGSYVTNSDGGVLFLSVTHFDYRLYDCVWVVKKQPGFNNIFINLISFTTFSDSAFQDDSIEIRSGLTSDGDYLAIVHPTETQKVTEVSDSGFYVRLRGSFSEKEKITFSYASVKYEDYLHDCRDDKYFKCSDGKCISLALKCDGYDHCGDGSDEISGCTGSFPGDSYQTSITVGVVVPLVVSLFVIVTVCLLFLVVRRCRRVAREAREMVNPVPTVSGHISTQRRRARGGLNCFDAGTEENDNPPTYEEALGNRHGMLNMGFSGAERCFMMPPPPPTYDEAMSPTSSLPPMGTEGVLSGDSPSSTSSSDLPVQQSQNSTNSSTMSEGGWQSNVHSYSMSYSSDSEFDSPRGPSQQLSTEPVNQHSSDVQDNGTSVEQARDQPDCQTTIGHVGSSQTRPSHKEESSNVGSRSQIDQNVRGKTKYVPASQTNFSPRRKENISCAARNQNNRDLHGVLPHGPTRSVPQNERRSHGVPRSTNRHETYTINERSQGVPRSTNRHETSTINERNQGVPRNTNIHETNTRNSANQHNLGNPVEQMGMLHDVMPKQPDGSSASNSSIISRQDDDDVLGRSSAIASTNGGENRPIPRPRGNKRYSDHKTDRPQPAPRVTRPKPQRRSHSADNRKQYKLQTRSNSSDSCEQYESDCETGLKSSRSSGNISGQTGLNDNSKHLPSHSPGNLQTELKSGRRYTGNQIPYNPGNMRNLKRFAKSNAENKRSEHPMRTAHSDIDLHRIDVDKTHISESYHSHPPGDRLSMPYRLDASRVDESCLQNLPAETRHSEHSLAGRSRGGHSAWSSQPSLHTDIGLGSSARERSSYSSPSTQSYHPSNFVAGKMTRYDRIDLQNPPPQQTRNSHEVEFSRTGRGESRGGQSETPSDVRV